MSDASDWFFDVIIGFLRSPRWKTPVMSFLDDKCANFDGSEENSLEHTTIHNVRLFISSITFTFELRNSRNWLKDY